MAIFKVPRITTLQRNNLVLGLGEIVFDTDQELYYGGNGEDLGGFLIGTGAGSYVDRIQLTEDKLNNKYIQLRFRPLDSTKVLVTPEGGVTQVKGVDFEVFGDTIVWDGLGLDGFLDETDVLIIQY